MICTDAQARPVEMCEVKAMAEAGDARFDRPMDHRCRRPSREVRELAAIACYHGRQGVVACRCKH
jgi:hypothetical protein